MWLGLLLGCNLAAAAAQIRSRYFLKPSVPTVVEPFDILLGYFYRLQHINSFTTKKQTTKFSSANFQKMLSQAISY